MDGDGLPNAPAACGFPSGIPGLVDILNNLATLPGIEIVRYDAFSKFVQLVNAPMDGEPQNGQFACVMPDTHTAIQLQGPWRACFLGWHSSHEGGTQHSCR